METINNLIKNYCNRVQMVKFDFDESKRYNYFTNVLLITHKIYKILKMISGN